MTEAVQQATSSRPARPSQGRALAARIIAWLFAFAATVLYMGLIDLATLPGWVDQAYEWPVPLEVSWGSLFTFVLAGGFVWVALFPARPWPGLVQLAVGGVALLLCSVGGADWRPLWIGVVVLIAAAALWWLTVRVAGPVPRTAPMSWPLLLLAGAGVPLWVPYVLLALEQSRAGVEGDVTNGIEHWPVQGAAGIAIVLCSLAVVFWEAGRPLMRLTVSLSAVLVGVAELAYPDRDGAMGSPLWAMGVVVWGLAAALLIPARHHGAGREA